MNTRTNGRKFHVARHTRVADYQSLRCVLAALLKSISAYRVSVYRWNGGAGDRHPYAFRRTARYALASKSTVDAPSVYAISIRRIERALSSMYCDHVMMTVPVLCSCRPPPGQPTVVPPSDNAISMRRGRHAMPVILGYHNAQSVWFI